MNFNLEHVISLIFFNHKINVQCDFTDAIFDFNQLVEEANPEGQTKLYDAMMTGILKLSNIKRDYSACKRRMIVLTDGEDNKSKYKPK